MYLEIDMQNQTLLDLRQKLQNAMASNDQAAFAQAFEELLQFYAKKNLEDFQALREETDSRVLAQRGVRQLTSTERTFYQKLGEAMNSADPRQAVNNLDVVMPETVFDSIFEDIETDHSLLSVINFMNTRGAIRMMMNAHGYQRAVWGKLCSPIIQEITSGFKEVETGLFKLSAFIPVCKAMLDLGPEWLDRYVRMILTEALANGMEYSIVNGTGKDEPIGMSRQVGEEVSVTGGVYPEKAPITVSDFSPATMGNLVSILAADPNGRARRVDGLILVVNPQDYYQTVMPATTIQSPDGTYRNDVFPVPLQVIQSPAKPRGRASFGIGRLYWAFAGMNKDGRIEYSDEYHFLEDERVYLIKTYGNGMPADNNAFLELDISNLKPARYKVTMVEESAPSNDAGLSDLRIGSLPLSPSFSSTVTSYTAATANATNTINAMPSNAAASIKVKVNGTEMDNGTAASWQDGSNTVEVTVTAEDGKASQTYTVTVTRSNV